ncbi:hypothetical protein E4U17_007840 [Claviceps sp. LM77 group G4]|nr:hypothetical protein E4U17_007840 [Claviceps sp. LM77 group G4]KAG6083551.1 hypothetical protein E4U16_003960 [Claviceps sp. LM84 group G4]KAG6085070.1 hypothetical protein E4U33_002502 [Claviceps sp. LM78 group G4]
MASSAASSLRTLVRPSVLSPARRIVPQAAAAALFSTTSSPLAAIAAIPPPPVRTRRMLPTSRKSKKRDKAPGKKPASGERKAFRKRIQLSNNSALPVEGLEEASLEALIGSGSETSSRMLAIPDPLVDQLRTLEAFKTTQTWNLFRRPHFLLRLETKELMGKLAAAMESKDTLRCVITGDRLSGKSLILLQAMAYGLMSKCVVIHIPEGQDLTNGNTDYSPIEGTEPMQFAQPSYCLNFLQKIHKANESVLKTIPLQQDWTHLDPSLKIGSATLANLIAGVKESENAWPTVKALWSELLLPGRPPVLFTLDGLAHINKFSDYRDPSFNKVHAHDLCLVRLFVDALSGKIKLTNGGAVIAATSGSNSPYIPSQALALNQLDAAQRGLPIPAPEPYESKYDARVADSLKDCQVFRVGYLSKQEARNLMEYWTLSGLLRTVLDSRVVAEKWALGGHGIIGQLEKASLMTMRV